MALYILVHHKHDPRQPWKNNWLDATSPDPSVLEYIFTKPELAQKCEIERAAGNRVFIHRCAHKSSPRIICTSAEISSVDLSLNKVTFENHQIIHKTPPRRANQGQISYFA